MSFFMKNMAIKDSADDNFFRYVSVKKTHFY